MRLTLDIAGRRLTLDLTLQRQAPEVLAMMEPLAQGSTCGDLERRPNWDHDLREPVGFRATLEPAAGHAHPRPRPTTSLQEEHPWLT